MEKSNRLQKLEQDKARIERKMRLEKRRIAHDERKRENRRKIIAGAVLLKFADETLLSSFHNLASQHLAPRDRDLFPEIDFDRFDNVTVPMDTCNDNAFQENSVDVVNQSEEKNPSP